MRSSLAVLAAVPLLMLACGSEPSLDPIETGAENLTLDSVKPFSKVYVKSAGALDVETEYLPQVVCCENGAAHPEALKAQAVMARTYMAFRYYEDDRGTEANPFAGTTADQAYFCKQPVTAACKDAVNATAGQITAYTDASAARFVNVSFFIDGPRPACLADKSCTCPMGSPTTSYTPTDHPADCECFTFSSQGGAPPAYVTYNWSRSGDDVLGSTIGSLKHESNRGCASQNIQNCLGYAGWTYRDMLRMFYGQDIELRFLDGTEVGTKVDAEAPPAPVPDAGIPETVSSEPPDDAPARFANKDAGGCSLRNPSRSDGGPSGGGALLALVAAVALRRRRGLRLAAR